MKLRVAFRMFNQFKVTLVHKHQILLLLAWLSRVTYVLRHKWQVADMYSNNSTKGGDGNSRRQRSALAERATDAECVLLLEVLKGWLLGWLVCASHASVCNNNSGTAHRLPDGLAPTPTATGNMNRVTPPPTGDLQNARS